MGGGGGSVGGGSGGIGGGGGSVGGGGSCCCTPTGVAWGPGAAALCPPTATRTMAATAAKTMRSRICFLNGRRGRADTAQDVQFCLREVDPKAPRIGTVHLVTGAFSCGGSSVANPESPRARIARQPSSLTSPPEVAP
jgi:hypothetical protein